MAAKRPPVQLSGIGTHQIDFKIADAATRKRVMECIRKNGRISVMIGGGVTNEGPNASFGQFID